MELVGGRIGGGFFAGMVDESATEDPLAPVIGGAFSGRFILLMMPLPTRRDQSHGCYRRELMVRSKCQVRRDN